MYTNMSFEEELVLFYNKYLNIGLEENYLVELVNRYLKIWKQKKINKDNLSNIDIKSFTFSDEDYNKFSKLDQEFLNFYHLSCIKINEDFDIVIDAFGNICRFIFKTELDIAEKQALCQYLNQNIFTFLASLPNNLENQEIFVEVENIILQNILASKIFKAIYERIALESDLIQASVFALANSKIFNYDNELKEKLNYEELFKTKLAYSRSRR